MAGIFSRIVKGEIPCHKIAETDQYLAFLDVFPLAKGHTLVIPKKETDYIFDMDDQELSGMMVFAKKIAKAVGSVIPCKKVGVAVVGLEVLHAHIHLIPINNVSDMSFEKAKLQLPKEELEQIAQKIKTAFESQNK